MSNKKPFHLNASPEIFERANNLKRTMTKAEKLLWHELRASKLGGHKFRRQHPIDKFIVDFYCHEAKLVVELDGEVHDFEDVKKRDTFEERAQYFVISETLKDARKEAHMTQEELADKVGTKKSYISRLENGKCDIQLSTLYRIFEDGLGLRINLLIG